MNGTTLHLENGEIILAHDRIRIQDNAGKYKIIRLIFSTVGIINGLSGTWRFQDYQDSFEQTRFWIGVFITSGFVLYLIGTFRQSAASEVLLEAVKKITFRSNMLGEEKLVLTLNNGLQRTLSISAPVANDLQTYFDEKGF
jgi:hypothetical protein